MANLVNEMWEAATVVEEAAERSDFKLKDYEPAFPPFTVRTPPHQLVIIRSSPERLKPKTRCLLLCPCRTIG